MSSQPVSSQRGRVREILDEFVQRRAAGEELDDQTLIAAHPELMPTLGRELALLHVMHRAVHRAGPAGNSSSAAARRPALPAAEIRGYRLLREVHRGGQGVVYQALQESTGRTVAIKVMREGPFAGKSDRARFEREVGILARLKHPNIVTIHDKGIAGGATYFVMDYIDGPPLDQWISEPPTPVEGDGGAPSRSSLRETPRPGGRGSDARGPIGNRKSEIGNLVRLFSKICDAVHAAHLRGIIHRDLKPSNIRIDRDGEPHVLDFGLAKEISEAGAVSMTADGQFVGSLPWASPEQVRGTGIDVRTDVYSLGVILFQSLTGAMPYDVRGPMGEVIERITSTAPTSPRALCHPIDPDLEIIVLRCLAKEPERRYHSAGELARDIRHYLAGEAIEARRDSAVYVLLKHARRYRWALAGAAAFVLVLAAFASYAGLEARRFRQLAQSERDAREAAQMAERTAGAARVEADRQRDAQAEQRLTAQREAERARAVTEFLINTLGLADPDVTQAPDATMKTMLDHAAQQVGTAFAEQPGSEANVQLVIGRAYATLGELELAKAHLARAVELHETVLGSDVATLYEALWPYVHVLDELADTAWRANWWKLWRLYPKLFRGHHPEVAAAIANLKEGYVGEAYDAHVAEPLHAELWRTAGAVLKPDDPGWLVLADFLHIAGANLALEQSPQPGCAYLREALQIERRFLPETHTRIIRTLGELVRASIDARQYVEAEALTSDSQALVRRILPEDHWYLAVYQARLGACRAGQQRFEEAERLLVDNLARIEAARGPGNLFAREAMERLIDLYDAWGRPGPADEWRTSLAARMVGFQQYHRPARQLKRIFGPRYAELYAVLERFNRARGNERRLEALGQLLALRQQELPDDHVYSAIIAECLCSAGNAIANRTRPNEHTFVMLREAERIARAASHLHPRKQAWIFWNLARNLQSRGEPAEAERLAREALALLESRYESRDALVLDVRGLVGACLLEQQRYDEAERVLSGVLQDRLAIQGANSAVEADLLRLLKLYQATRRPGEGLTEAYAVSRRHRLAWPGIQPLVAARYPALANAFDALRNVPAGEVDRLADALQAVLDARRTAFDVHEPIALVYAGALCTTAARACNRTYDPVWLPAFREALEIELAHFSADLPRIGTIHWWLATLLNRAAQYEDAEHYARQALQIVERAQAARPENSPTRDSPLAGALIGQGRYAAGEPLLLGACPAIATAESLREPYGSECFRYLLNHYATTGRSSEARFFAEPILRGELGRHSDGRLMGRLAEHVIRQCGLDQQLYALALEAAQTARKLLPNDTHISLVIACAHYRLGQFEDARGMLERATKSTQRDGLTRAALMAMTYARLGQSQSAGAALQLLASVLHGRAAPTTSDERALLAEVQHLVAP